MSRLIAEDPWDEIGSIFVNRAVTAEGGQVAESEHNYFAQKVPDSAGVDDPGETTFGLATDLLMKPGRSETFDYDSRFRNYDGYVIQNWDNSGHTYSELSYDPVGDEEIDYDLTAGFTVGTGGAGGSVGISIDGGKIRHDDRTTQYSLDSKVHHNWDFPGIYECDKARCSEVVLGNVGKIDADEPSDDSIDYCPTETKSVYRDPDLNKADAYRYFNPSLYYLENYY